jgi:hypothetical protein
MRREMPIVWTNEKDEKGIRENQGDKVKKGRTKDRRV